MKRCFLYAYLFLSCVICGCNDYNNEVLLNRLISVQNEGDTCPYNALERYDSLGAIFEHENEYLRSKYALLGVRLRDKAFITHTNDSVINLLYDYFINDGNRCEKQEVCYYMGSVYRDLHDTPRAVKYFLEAIQVAETEANIDSAILVASYSQLSNIYIKIFNYDEALIASIKALHIAESAGIETERDFANVASCYSKLNDIEGSIRYSKIILKRIIKKNDIKNNADIIAKRLADFAKFGYKAEADYCYALLQHLPEDARPKNYLINLAVYCRNCVSPDSAAAVFHRIQESDKSIAQQYNSTQFLMKYYASVGNYEEATRFVLLFIDANRNLLKDMNVEQTLNARNEFQYIRDRDKEAAMVEQIGRTRLIWAVSIIVMILLLMSLLFFHYHRQRRLLKIIMERNNAVDNARGLIQKYEEELEQSHNIIEAKEKELVTKYSMIETLDVELKNAEDSIKRLMVQNETLTKFALMKKFSAGTEDAAEIIAKYKRAADGKCTLSEDDWSELIAAVDCVYPNFTSEINERLKDIKLHNLRICYLLKIGMTNPQIVNITGNPPQTVWYRVKRIKEAFENNR